MVACFQVAKKPATKKKAAKQPAAKKSEASKKPAGTHGGARKGAGRPKGAKTQKKKTAPKKKVTKKKAKAVPAKAKAASKAKVKAPSGSPVTISVVHCAGKKNWSTITEVKATMKKIEATVLATAEQNVGANEAKGLHNGALHDEFGKVTYLQRESTLDPHSSNLISGGCVSPTQLDFRGRPDRLLVHSEVNKGGFYVLTGNPKQLVAKFFAAGTFVAFIDFEGPGHASRTGPQGVQRTFRLLTGHLKV